MNEKKERFKSYCQVKGLTLSLSQFVSFCLTCVDAEWLQSCGDAFFPSTAHSSSLPDKVTRPEFAHS